MAVHSILPKENLTGDDIRDTLNANGGRVTNDCTTFFSVGAGVWKWSRWKPVIHTEPFNLTDAMLVSSHFGLTTPAGSNDPATAASGEYIYNLPAGNMAQPWRMSDFRNYNPKALSPCPKQNNVTVNTFYGTDATFIPNINISLDSYSIGVSDFSFLVDCYPAIVFTITSGSSVYRYYRTADHTIGDNSAGEWNVLYSYNEPPFNDSRTVISDVYWVAAAKRYIKGDSEPYLQKFYALPYNTPDDAKFTVTIKRGSPLLFSVIGLCHSYDQYTSDDIRDYESGNNRWYDLTNHGTLYYEFDVRNNGSTRVVLNVSNFTISANQSFASGHIGMPTGKIQPEIYDYTTGWKKVTALQLGPGGREPFRIGVPHFLSYWNGNEYQIGSGQLQEIVSTLMYSSTRMATTPPIDGRMS